MPIEGVEELERYRVGGSHPVDVGDRFQDRYQVVQKFGRVSYSTIWFARDERLNKYVAIKVCTAVSNPHEFEVLSNLSSSRQVAGNGNGLDIDVWLKRALLPGKHPR